MRYGVTRKKRLTIQEICFERAYSQKMLANSRPKVTHIIDLRKALYRQRIPGSSCEMKETVDILIP